MLDVVLFLRKSFYLHEIKGIVPFFSVADADRYGSRNQKNGRDRAHDSVADTDRYGSRNLP